MISKEPSDALKAMIKELTDVMVKRVMDDNLSQVEVLAALAIMTGQALALQDQRTMTPAMGMDLIVTNIEFGNQTMVEQLLGKPKGSG